MGQFGIFFLFWSKNKVYCQHDDNFEFRYRSEECSRRQGYMGHLVRISNSLVKFGEKDEQVLSLCEKKKKFLWL